MLRLGKRKSSGVWSRLKYVLVMAVAALWCGEASAGGFSNFYYHRSSQTGRTYFFGNSYGNGGYSNVIGSYNKRGGYTIGSGSQYGRTYGGYSYRRGNGGGGYSWGN